MIRNLAIATLLIGIAGSGALASDATASLKRGDAQLKSAGPLAFGPDGVLFVADTRAATIFAIATEDTAGDAEKASVNVEGVNGKIASMLGVAANQVQINDVAANPLSGRVYLSVSRGRGPDAAAVILRVDSAGKISELALKGVRFATAKLPNPPADKIVGQGRRQQNNRDFCITDLSFIDNRLVVAGLSNEEFSSNLREIPFPFSKVNPGAAIEIFHGSHGRLETRSPIRTFVPMNIDGSPQIIAAYTCTPLVRIPLTDLKAGAKVRGTTVAELGNHNRPLDIIAYQKDGKNYLLMANNARGVMKIGTDDIATRQSINQQINGKAGQTYDTIDGLKDVTQLDQLNKTHAVILVESKGRADLRTIPLP